MSTSNVIRMLPRTVSGPVAQIREFEQDVADLLSFRRQGHMEKWEYWDADFYDDPAGGQQFWEALVKQPGAYYLPAADMNMINRAVHKDVVDLMIRDIKTVVELGPGSPESIARKTLPFLKYAEKYIAVDLCIQQAEHAATQVHDALGIDTESVIADYLNPGIRKEGREKIAFVMWGGSIGNIEGLAGKNAQAKLTQSLAHLSRECNPGDTVFIGLDVESRRDILTAAYNVPLLSRKFLSVLHAAKKFGLTAGHFTPETWTHRSVWHDVSQQCAHYLIAGEDQDFMIAGRRIKMPAGKAVITNNSYKFSPAIAEEAARQAGFSRVFISDDRPIAMLMATK